MTYKQYYDMGRIEQLMNSGREFIGKELFITVKRDGQNCVFYKNANSDMIHIGSHHKAVCDDSMRENIKSTKEYKKVIEMINDNSPNNIYYFEHIMRGRSPTRIERKKKHNFLVLIDIFNTEQNRYLSYNYTYQQAYKYKIPMVELLDVFTPTLMTDLYEIKEEWLTWAKKHSREGMVIKDYYSKHQCFAKEKIDLPKRTKYRVKDNRPQLPSMPREKILSAVNQAMAEVLRNNIDPKDKSLAMPIVAKYVATEAREHCYATVNGIFQYYIDYLRDME